MFLPLTLIAYVPTFLADETSSNVIPSKVLAAGIRVFVGVKFSTKFESAISLIFTPPDKMLITQLLFS